MSSCDLWAPAVLTRFLSPDSWNREPGLHAGRGPVLHATCPPLAGRHGAGFCGSVPAGSGGPAVDAQPPAPPVSSPDQRPVQRLLRPGWQSPEGPGWPAFSSTTTHSQRQGLSVASCSTCCQRPRNWPQTLHRPWTWTRTGPEPGAGMIFLDRNQCFIPWNVSGSSKRSCCRRFLFLN